MAEQTPLPTAQQKFVEWKNGATKQEIVAALSTDGFNKIDTSFVENGDLATPFKDGPVGDPEQIDRKSGNSP